MATCPACGSARTLVPVAEVAVVEAKVSVVTAETLARYQAGDRFVGETLRHILTGPFGSDPLSLAFYGLPGSRKTTMMLQIAGEIADQETCLFASAEEGVRSTLAEKLRRLEIHSPNLMLTNDTNILSLVELAEQRRALWLFLDSVTILRLLPVDITAIASRGLNLVFAMHATKEGEYAGPSGIIHAVDAAVKLDAGRFCVTKNRFGPALEGALDVVTGV